MPPSKSHKKINKLVLINNSRKKHRFNPKTLPLMPNSNLPVQFQVIEYNEHSFTSFETTDLKKITEKAKQGFVKWIRVFQYKTETLEELGGIFNIHPLIIEDILSRGQRAKVDDFGDQLFIMLPVLFFNPESSLIEIEQLSMIVAENILISFEGNFEDNHFMFISERLQNPSSAIRKKKSDYLGYTLMDSVIDNYFSILEPISFNLDEIEEKLMKKPDKSDLVNLSLMRQELMFIKKNIMPVRELINSMWHSDNKIIEHTNKKYFKDIYDHITLAIEYNENYRDLIMNLQDLYMNQVNAKMNEVMKILTVVTTILAPLTVISSIYGMNFEKIPFSGQQYGFEITIGIMIFLVLIMLLIFKKKGWF